LCTLLEIGILCQRGIALAVYKLALVKGQGSGIVARYAVGAVAKGNGVVGTPKFPVRKAAAAVILKAAVVKPIGIGSRGLHRGLDAVLGGGDVAFILGT